MPSLIPHHRHLVRRFTEAVTSAVEATIVARLAASADHPVALAFPEGDYLKGLLLAKAA